MEFQKTKGHGGTIKALLNWAHTHTHTHKPKDNAEKYLKQIITKNESKDKIALRLHGGVFTSDGYKGNLKDILKR